MPEIKHVASSCQMPLANQNCFIYDLDKFGIALSIACRAINNASTVTALDLQVNWNVSKYVLGNNDDRDRLIFRALTYKLLLGIRHLLCLLPNDELHWKNSCIRMGIVLMCNVSPAVSLSSAMVQTLALHNIG